MGQPKDSSSTAGTPSHQAGLLWTIAGLAVVTAVFVSGCRSEECARMLACCQQVKDVEGVGEACGPQATALEDPKTCKSILETIGYMFEDEDKELPEVCKLEESS